MIRNVTVVLLLVCLLWVGAAQVLQIVDASPLREPVRPGPAGATPGGLSQSPAAAAPSVNALWVFSDELSSPLDRNALVEATVASQVNVLYVSVYRPYANSTGRRLYEEADIAALITAAHARGVQVWAAYSSYEWTSLGCEATGVPLLRMQEVQAYNLAHPNARFDGVMLDLELNQPQVSDYQQLLGLHRCIRDTAVGAGLKIGTAISAFWETAIPYPATGPTKPVYQHVLDLNFDQVVIMGYRNYAGTPCGGAQSNGAICLVENEVRYAKSQGTGSRVILGLDTENCTPQCGPTLVTLFDGGQTQLNHVVDDLYQAYPDVGGVAIHRYRAAYLTGTPAWPTANPLYPARGGTSSGTVDPALPVDGALHFVSPPIRIVDTRAGSTVGFGADGAPIGAGQLPSGSTTRFKIGGLTLGGAAIPANLTGALLNVTIVQNAPSGGFVTVFSGDGLRPTASTVNPGIGTNANFAVTAVSRQAGSADSVAVYSVGGNRDILVDIVGYYRVDVAPAAASATRTTRDAATGNLRLVSPVRVLDSRAAPTNGTGPIGVRADGSLIGPAPLPAGQATRLQLAGRTFGGGGNTITFPPDTAGVLAHVTTVQAQGSGGFVALLPGDWGLTGGLTPTTSTVNPVTPVAFNTTAIGLPPAGSTGAGTFAIYTTSQLDATVDVVGYFAPSNAAGQPGVVGNPYLITPTRIVDTRPNDSSAGITTTGFGLVGGPVLAGPLAAGEIRRYLVGGQQFAAGAVSIPADVKGVLVNVTTVQTRPGGGYAVIYPADLAAAPNASAVNPSTNVAAAAWATNLNLAPSANPGSLAIYSSGDSRDVLIDAVAYFR